MSKIEMFTDRQDHEIARRLRTAKTFVLVAMAWFTDRALFDILLQKAEEGLQVLVLLHHDDVNTVSGISYDKLNIKNSQLIWIKDNKKILHHKFCVIDFYTVIQGSYNWTNQARSNHEDVTIVEGDIQYSASFITQFYKIKKEYYREEQSGQRASQVLPDGPVATPSFRNWLNRRERVFEPSNKGGSHRVEFSGSANYKLSLHGTLFNKLKQIVDVRFVVTTSEKVTEWFKEKQRLTPEILELERSYKLLNQKLRESAYFQITLKRIESATDREQLKVMSERGMFDRLIIMKAELEKIIASANTIKGPTSLHILADVDDLKSAAEQHLKYADMVLNRQFNNL